MAIDILPSWWEQKPDFFEKSGFLRLNNSISLLVVAVKTAAIQTKPACLEKVLYLGKPQDRTFRYAG
jgi:hypothetical protein